MRKLVIVLALLIGFVLGSRAGRSPYDRFEAEVRRLRRKPEVRDMVDSVRDAVGERATGLADKVTSSVSGPRQEESPWPASTAV